MDHTFSPMTPGSAKCAKCQYDFMSHTNMAVCEACPNIGPVRPVFGGILMCEDCIAKETAAQLENMKSVNQEARVNNLNKVIETARLIDNSIEVRTDIFNAATTSIIELKAAIDADDSIENKPYALAEELTKRFQHHKQVVFDLNEQIIEAGNQQKAIQVYLNELSNKLRSEEREKLHIADINYKPGTPKPKVVKPIKVSTVSKKIDKAELKKYATELGINEYTLQMVVVQKGLSVEAVANMLRKSINEAKSESQS